MSNPVLLNELFQSSFLLSRIREKVYWRFHNSSIVIKNIELQSILEYRRIHVFAHDSLASCHNPLLLVEIFLEGELIIDYSVRSKEELLNMLATKSQVDY